MLLDTIRVEKVWGREHLPAPFADAEPGKPVGEIWFEPQAPVDDLLVKYLFTSERLSVQVHPADQPGQRGKTECWLITATEPGAQLAAGFKQPVDAAAMRAAALDGSIEDLLEWHAVTPGDFVYVPPGTVHAIGAGVSLIEIQQNSDITYRLYDYGRPRELHLDEGMAVAHGVPHDAAFRSRVPDSGSVMLCDRVPFRVARCEGALPEGFTDAPLLAIPLEEGVAVAGEAVAAGGCAMADGPAAITFGETTRWLAAQPV